MRRILTYWDTLGEMEIRHSKHRYRSLSRTLSLASLGRHSQLSIIITAFCALSQLTRIVEQVISVLYAMLELYLLTHCIVSTIWSLVLENLPRRGLNTSASESRPNTSFGCFAPNYDTHLPLSTESEPFAVLIIFRVTYSALRILKLQRPHRCVESPGRRLLHPLQGKLFIFTLLDNTIILSSSLTGVLSTISP